MKTYPHGCIRRSLGFLALSLLGCFSLHADDLQSLKMYGKWTAPYYVQMGFSFNAKSRALSDKWVMLGAFGANEQYNGQGAVQVFDAVTGAWVRKLLPPAGGKSLGYSCAISGNLGIASALNAGSVRTVVIYDLATGKFLREIANPGLPTNGFGQSIAAAAGRLIVTAPNTESSRGLAYVYSLTTGALITTLQPDDTVAGDTFGIWVATDGQWFVISAYKGDGTKGCAYLYDLKTATMVKKLTSATAAAGTRLGWPCAITEGKVVLGSSFITQSRLHVFDIIRDEERVYADTESAPNTSGTFAMAAHSGIAVSTNFAGKVYAFDLRSSNLGQMSVITAPDRGELDYRCVDLNQGVLLAGDTSDSSLNYGAADGTFSGAGYLFRTLTRPLPMAKVAARGDSATGVADATFNKMGDAFISPDGAVAFNSTLLGAGSNKGKVSGLWSSQKPNIGPPVPGINLVLKTGDDVLGSPATAVGIPLFNSASLNLFIATRTGANNRVIMKDNGSEIDRLRQNVFGTPDLAFQTLVRSHMADRAAWTLTMVKGVNGVSATNDSGLVLVKPSETSQVNGTPDLEREGGDIDVSGIQYGQFTGRVALYNLNTVYTAATLSGPATNQVLLRKEYGVAETIVAGKGTLAAGVGANYSAFIGESVESGNAIVYRATLAPAAAAMNEGLWLKDGLGVHTLVMRKGEGPPEWGGLKIASFINYWATQGQVLALVKLSGPGVNAANDQALLLYQTTAPVAGKILVLMREGDPAGGCAPATIGVISRVEVETLSGQYLVLATLAGAPAGSNQCLFRGASARSVATVGSEMLRRPVVVLRKGELFTGRVSRLKSISLPVSNITASGAGSTGLSSAMLQTGDFVVPDSMVLTLEFENGVRQIMKGTL